MDWNEVLDACNKNMPSHHILMEYLRSAIEEIKELKALQLDRKY